MRSCRPIVMLVLLLIAATGHAEEQPDGAAIVEELAAKADPEADADWITEALQARAKQQLDRLAGWLCHDEGQSLESLALPDALAGELEPAQAEPFRSSGDWRGERAGEAAPTKESTERPLRRALARLGGPLAPSTRERRCKFKVVGIQATDREMTTEVRFEAAARGAGGPIQQVARWNVDWKRSEGEDRLPRIRRITLLDLQRLTRPGPLYVERTASVLSTAPEALEQLRFGGDYWYGRIDAVGEPNLMGHQGLALGDVNGDGLEDLYVATGTGLPNKLLVQNPDGTLRETAAEAAVAWLDDTKGALFADMDNDGDQDLVLAIGPTVVLCKNDGSGKFERFVSMRAPTPAAFYSLSVVDYDLDGDLDIYGTRYVKVSYGVSVPVPFHDANNGPTNHLLRNDGDDRFVDVTTESGLNVNNGRFSLMGAWADYDDDGDPDLYVSNDFGRNNLFRNDGGRFVDVAAEAGAEDQAAGMGATWSDYDLDGDLDLYVTNMYSAAGHRVAYQQNFHAESAEDSRQGIQRHALGNSLLANQGDGTFRDVSDAAGVRMGRWGWGAVFVDWNNDAYDDIVVPNGFLTGTLEDDL